MKLRSSRILKISAYHKTRRDRRIKVPAGSAVVIFVAVAVSIAVGVVIGIVVGIAIYRTHAGCIFVAVIVRRHCSV